MWNFVLDIRRRVPARSGCRNFCADNHCDWENCKDDFIQEFKEKIGYRSLWMTHCDGQTNSLETARSSWPVVTAPLQFIQILGVSRGANRYMNGCTRWLEGIKTSVDSHHHRTKSNIRSGESVCILTFFAVRDAKLISRLKRARPMSFSSRKYDSVYIFSNRAIDRFLAYQIEVG